MQDHGNSWKIMETHPSTDARSESCATELDWGEPLKYLELPEVADWVQSMKI